MCVNSELSATFLVEGKETYLSDFLIINEHWNFKNKSEMRKALEHGTTQSSSGVDASGDFFAKYMTAMRSFSRSGVSQAVKKELNRISEFKEVRRMLDLGGAYGMDCIAAAMSNPQLQGVVFDKPEVVGIAESFIEEYGMQERITVLGGDYLTDSLDSGYDLVYTKGTLNFAGPGLTEDRT